MDLFIKKYNDIKTSRNKLKSNGSLTVEKANGVTRLWKKVCMSVRANMQLKVEFYNVSLVDIIHTIQM